ncbi:MULTISPECIES: hypothetical protein [Pseudomonas]|jgi:hypothetical protein|uniref:Lipoxygenase domain-containing protein n=1 Tax=Pseudomonas fluorescens TaxID=294 RepID=A0A5E6SVZ6_PSEFL|nr:MULTISPECIES: hypothetical protein [Pseudomonas]VVM82803.1 hypothetical protein PS652_02374 [Pseudomonas fluorescens]
MLEKILFAFYVTTSPILFLIRFTKNKTLAIVYRVMVKIKLVPVLLILYSTNVMLSYIAWKITEIKMIFPRLFGHKNYNKDYVEMHNKKILGTDYHLAYISDRLPAELVYKWRKDKVYHNYISSIIRANLDYVNVVLDEFQAPTPISDDELKNFIFSSQASHYLQQQDGYLTFDMSSFHNEQVLPNISFDVRRFWISDNLNVDTMEIEMFDGARIKQGSRDWDLAKIYFLSNTMVFFIMGAHLHHHLFFAEMGAVSLFNRLKKGSNLYKLLSPHTAYTLMLNDQFKNSPLSLRETPGIFDKFLYSCIGYYSPDTFYKVGYENALNMYGKRDTLDESLTKQHRIRFDVPFNRYVTGSTTLNQQLNAHYNTVREFVSAIYDDLLLDEGIHDVNTWVSDVCHYVEIPVEKDASFNIDVIATYIWYVSFVHSMEHYQFYKLMKHYCLLTRTSFAKAAATRQAGGEVFSQYDLWKSKHIVLTFGKNHLNKGICESYADIDYHFNSDLLRAQQDKFKLKVQTELVDFKVPAEAIALSIRY